MRIKGLNFLAHPEVRQRPFPPLSTRREGKDDRNDGLG